MRSLKSGLFAFALSGLFGTVAVVGCSADGGGADLGQGTDPTDPGSSGAVVPPRGEPEEETDSGKKDAGKKDAAPKPEAGVDAGPPPPVAGTVCPTLNAIAQKNCGACGKAETVCLDDGGTKKWSVYGACQNELAGGCVPGTMVQEDCGNCGKVTKTCTQYCAYTSGQCLGQPASSCVPGSTEYISAGCPVAQTYRNRACSPTCTWGGVSSVCDAPNNPNKLNIAPTAGATVTGNYTLAATKMGPRITGSCPGASVSTTVDHPYEIVEIKNTSTTQTAKVSAWLSGPTIIDTVMAAYQTNLPPQNDTERKACKVGVNDDCYSLPCSTDSEWSGLTGTQQLTIPPGQVMLVWFASYYPKSSATYVTTGSVVLSLKTDLLQ